VGGRAGASPIKIHCWVSSSQPYILVLFSVSGYGGLSVISHSYCWINERCGWHGNATRS
jgi:hypothetical protein